MKNIVVLTVAILLCAGCATDKVGEKAGLPKDMTLDLGKGATMKLVLVPAGTFMMGSKPGPAENIKKFGAPEKYFALEYPRHKVTLTKPFYIGVYEVTQPQYVAVMGSGPLPWLYQKKKPKMLTKLGPGYPASWVHWHEAMEFCSKLSKTLGKKVYLPTEAQWE
jgi:formylglycine-generating enzyme required for sulfatase activity